MVQGFDLTMRAKRLFEREAIVAWPFLARWQVARIAHRGPGVDPPDDRIDLGIGQRDVVDELLDANGLIEVPRRHLARRDASPNRPDPGTHFLIG
jgi:hypothetical protein